ncbi:MAG: hypothetical protein NTZ83_01390 [Candidatus Pacearchaeota archaeon]|nr:hypothetical protein [Candidatus Pacearchaeota archaeon]
MEEILEKKIVEDWDINKKVFNNLKVGYLLDENNVVCYNDKKDNVMAHCWRNSSGSINTLCSIWKNGEAEPIQTSWRIYYGNENWSKDREEYQRLDKLLKEKGL